MQKYAIIVLVLLLGAGAFLSKPSDPRANFSDYLVQKVKQEHPDGNVFTGAWDEMRAKNFAGSCIYKDRIFWVNVVKNDRLVYVGAFSHWFNEGELKADVNKVEEKASDEIHSVQKGADQLNTAKDKVIGQ